MLKRLWLAAPMLLVAAGRGAAQEQPNPSFYLVNKGPSAIAQVFATPVGMPNWGRDRLTGSAIPAGQSFPIRLPADGNCSYDIKVVYAGGRSEERRRLDTCAVDNVTFPSQRGTTAPRAQQSEDDPSFVLVNRSRSRVSELYLSLTDEESWGDDRLGDDTVPAGATKVIRLPRGQCVWDLRVVFANGEANEKRRLNLCQLTQLRVP